MQDDEAFREFVEAALPALLRFGHLLTGNREAAEDLVQTALMKTLRAWRGVVRKDDPLAYVKRAMVTGQYTSWRRWNARLADAAVPDLPVDDGSGERAERAAMLAALRHLPPRQRAVLVLRYYEDLSEQQIAAQLGCRPGTVKSQAARALATLNTVLSTGADDVEAVR